MKETKAIYGGTFDPPTYGHFWMIEQGAKLFDQLVVAVAVNPHKKCLFTPEERVEMLQKGMVLPENVQVVTMNAGLLVSNAFALGANFILRGIRSTTDFVYEYGMRNVNRDINSSIETVFLTPPREIAEVSSSMVKELVRADGGVKFILKYAPTFVCSRLLQEVQNAKQK
ncbi:MAG: pantetheine-phosphate adenylyltransferase [Parcubacteria group bacterium Gr01-1014_19]|nr:MAG: pantetheine-phosphate adenylyltransferase [Parcubacteria group bacterium Gr01-1014_19]